MSALDLESFVERTQAVVDATSPATIGETRAWLVEPLLEALGWDVHEASCRTNRAVDGTHFEYVCTIDGIPALLVATESFDDTLEKSRAASLVETMAWTGIDRTIYTNGRDLLLLAGTTEIDRLVCDYSELTAYESALEHYTRVQLEERLETDTREHVSKRLAIERATLLETFSDELAAVTGNAADHTAEFEAATERFLDQLITSFSDDTSAEAEHEDISRDVSMEFSEGSVIGGTSTDEASASTSEDVDTDSRPESDPAGSENDHPSTDRDQDESQESSYVVRFFNERGSIGAIGHSSPETALVGTTEYLFERGLSGVTVPWHPDDDADKAVLNANAVHPDGTPMETPHQLSNGLYLEASGDEETQATRIEELVSRAGLRVMLSGEWTRE
ncbi:hypothetical protein [Natronorubrum daqingense]|uniref:Uncharacterized protein n=1 Tax=Natronorubrum daqingense TaxID=588898 RepID=A0A1N6Z5Q8_9EURY|nr:hypothetical protein [Natronorubrum daqingense]APX95451.1 hypothetical protein BB347_01825 [Natronorubrum daqingense]SIR22154.1 hypothetical protein SAMN05421809_0689 [Natronorubrum daqingense]